MECMAAPSPLLERVREHGWRVTPQRRAVVVALTGDHLHLTAEEVHAAARRVVPEISLATVYNSLNELVAMGEIGEVRVEGSSVRYDPNSDRNHHHLVCEHCGLIMDVQPRGTDGVRLPPSERHGFVVRDAEILFRGTCSNCAEKS